MMNPPIHKLLPVGIIVGALICFAVVFQWVVFPFQELIAKKASNIEARRTLQENQESRVEELPQLQGQYDFILQNEEKLNALVSHDQVVPFIERIESLAHDNDVEISITNQDVGVKKKASVAPKKVADTSAEGEGSENSADKKKKDESILGNLPFGEYMALRFDVRGEYAKVVQFLHQIESLPYAVDVVALDIRQLEIDTGSARNVSSAMVTPPASPDGVTAASEEPMRKNMVQAFFDIVVYTKD